MFFNDQIQNQKIFQRSKVKKNNYYRLNRKLKQIS